MEFNPSNILRDYNTSIGNITLLENNPKNFRVIFQFRVKFPFLNFLGLNSKSVIFQKCYIPMRPRSIHRKNSLEVNLRLPNLTLIVVKG